jgi:hypothetical protein
MSEVNLPEYKMSLKELLGRARFHINNAQVILDAAKKEEKEEPK